MSYPLVPQHRYPLSKPSRRQLMRYVDQAQVIALIADQAVYEITGIVAFANERSNTLLNEVARLRQQAAAVRGFTAEEEMALQRRIDIWLSQLDRITTVAGQKIVYLAEQASA